MLMYKEIMSLIHTKLCFSSAPLAGFLGSRLTCRATVVMGGVLSAAGLVLSSFATSLEYLYVSLGILTGTQIHCLCFKQ